VSGRICLQLMWKEKETQSFRIEFDSKEQAIIKFERFFY